MPFLWFLNIYLREMNMYIHKKTFIRIFIFFIYNNQNLKQSKCPTTGRMDKQIVAYLYNIILLSNQEEWITQHVSTWTNT